MRTTKRVSEENLATPHFVEWGVSADPDGDFEVREFSSRADALGFADEMTGRNYAVWIGEIGDYETDKGNLIRDWVYYWWNEKSQWPLQERGRGGGYPYYAQSRAVSYTPFDK